MKYTTAAACKLAAIAVTLAASSAFHYLIVFALVNFYKCKYNRLK